jgi:phospholipase C
MAAIALVVIPGCARAPHASPAAVPTRLLTDSPRSSPAVGQSSVAGDATSIQSVVLIVMENHEYSSVVGSSDAAYINRRLIGHGKLFTSYDAVSHPSLPNYLAMTSGSTDGTQGTDSITAGEISRNNLFHQLARAGIRWRVYEESLPSACDSAVVSGTSPGFYALKHDPAMAYADIANTTLCRRVLPLSRLDPTRLRSFSVVTPNECNDMHSCPISTGDRWLRNVVPPLLDHGATVIVTFDEGSTSAGGGGHVLTVEDGAGVRPGSRNSSGFDHDSLLAGLERYFGVGRLRAATTARPLPI